MEYSDSATGYFALMALATLVVIYAMPAGKVMIPIAGFIVAFGTWLAVAPNVGTAQLVGLMTLAWVVAALVTVGAGRLIKNLRRERDIN